MALDQEKIRRAFRARLFTVEPDLGIVDRDKQIAVENRGFTPPAPEPPQAWVSESLAVGDEVLAATNMLELVGVLTYSIYWPLGRGTEKPAALARAIADACKPGSVVSRDGDPQIAVSRATCLNGREDESYEQSWWRVPVAITFRAYGTNKE